MKKLAIVLGVAVLACAALVHAQKGKPAAANTAGNGTLIIGAYPSQYWIIDEATEKIVGTIPVKSGIPRRTTLSRDRKRFYTIEAGREELETVDIPTRKGADNLSPGEGRHQRRSLRI